MASARYILTEFMHVLWHNVPHVCQDTTGVHSVGHYTLLSIFRHDEFSESYDGQLAHLVATQSREDDVCASRDDVNDLLITSFQHQRQERAGY